MADKGKYYITTAIAYASGKPHIGNTYEIILADAIARYKRYEGYDVHFQTGTDEHGQKIEDRAKAAGMTPKAFVDKTAGEIRFYGDSIVPTAGNKPYEKYIVTDLRGYISADSLCLSNNYGDTPSVYAGKLKKD